MQPTYNYYYVRVDAQLEVDVVQYFTKFCIPASAWKWIDKFLDLEVVILFKFGLTWEWTEEPVGSDGQLDYAHGTFERTKQMLVASITLGIRVRAFFLCRFASTLESHGCVCNSAFRGSR